VLTEGVADAEGARHVAIRQDEARASNERIARRAALLGLRVLPLRCERGEPTCDRVHIVSPDDYRAARENDHLSTLQHD
jgi:hypothetical protein